MKQREKNAKNIYLNFVKLGKDYTLTDFNLLDMIVFLRLRQNKYKRFSFHLFVKLI